MSIATDVRTYADLALEQGKAALSQANKRLAADAPKPVLAALGAADLLAEAVGKQAEALGRQAENLGKRMESLPELSAAAASTTSDYLDNARQAYGRLTARGEARWADLRKDPRVNRLLGDSDEAPLDASVVPAVETIKDADLGKPAGTTKPRARKAPAAKPAAPRRSAPKKA